MIKYDVAIFHYSEMVLEMLIEYYNLQVHTFPFELSYHKKRIKMGIQIFVILKT